MTYTDLFGLPSSIKFQVNFTELLMYPPSRQEAHSLLRGDPPAALVLLDDELTAAYAKPIAVDCYDLREIVAEKGRAILTRQGAKVRDVLDLYWLERAHGVRLGAQLDDVAAKTRFVLDRASRYGDQLDLRRTRFEALMHEDVSPLLLRQIDMEDFDAFRRETLERLDALAQDMAS